MTKKYLKIVGSTFIVSAFLLLAFGSEDSKSKSGESKDSNNSGVESNESNSSNVESNESNSSSGETDNSNNNSSSEETSKEVYRQGYADGQMGYGLPASETATAMESYMAHSYNFSSADIPVYVMGYNDAITGKAAEY
jgi:hypothetical protein